MESKDGWLVYKSRVVSSEINYQVVQEDRQVKEFGCRYDDHPKKFMYNLHSKSPPQASLYGLGSLAIQAPRA